MNCYDCAAQYSLLRPAVAVCHDCGAAVCEMHAVVRPHHLTRTALINRVEDVEPPGRTMRCVTCDAAYAALHRQPRAGRAA
jgi:hypothetical protein